MVRLQVKVIYATNYVNIERDMNIALDELKDRVIRDIKVDTDWAGQEDHYIGTIIFED